ncbi:MAG TPA: UDP-N-acetylmuramate dehydrogenase [Actinomycetota bacterium]|nr:UDP-N-acetylmuramate dehydrogenase [Actinomycetota bacterium]
MQTHPLAQTVADALVPRVAGTVRRGEPLGQYTSFRVGGPADVAVEAESEQDLTAVADLCGGMPVAVIGRGSNLLVSDDGFRGVALRLGRGFRTQQVGESTIVFGAAVSLPAAARLTGRIGLAGFEFAAEIPGSFGGGVQMNAGAHGRSISDVLVWADLLDLGTGRLERVPARDLSYGYRRSSVGERVVVRGEVRLEPDEVRVVQTRIAELLRWRRTHQPGGLSAGSVFKNPDGDSAGRLVDGAGGKGLRCGGAVVSDVHANFIVVEQGSTASDVWRLIWLVRDLVVERMGVQLEPEVRFLGDFPQVERHEL